MIKNLVIVESPAKAKTIEKYLGKDFVVVSSYGHIRDLEKKNNGVDIENNFKPIYKIPSEKKQVVKELKKLAKQSETIWLATDEDREGEAIAWHLKEALDLPEEKIKRIVFHEITKPAIQKAIENPRGIDADLVNAQQARRVLDRLVGFELSPVLWRKVKPKLSAGRVQSIAVRLIVEREREIMNFNPEVQYRLLGTFITENNNALIKSELNKKFKSKEEALKFLKTCAKGKFRVKSVEKTPAKKTPPPPFTTSTLQQEAARKLNFSVARTMLVAQKLYESGKITYMRTDSVNLSELAIASAKEKITQSYGKEYSKARKYKTKTKGAQEAHEAIRPTDFNKENIAGSKEEKALYQLIWKRAIASQMSDALMERTNVKIEITGRNEFFVAKGEVVKFDGYLKVYIESKEESNGENETSTLLPELIENQPLAAQEIKAIERFTRPPARYTEATLVKKLEELGIGRPSTYAPIINTIQKRGYVYKGSAPGKEREYSILVLQKDGTIKESVEKEIVGSEKGKLLPADIAMLVNDFLRERFPEIMDYKFTAKVEEELDEIAEGKLQWQGMLNDFYRPFHGKVETTIEKSERVSGERILGIDSRTGRQLSVRMAKFGPVAQLSNPENPEEKPEYAGLKPGQRLETITFEEALALFELPRNLGKYEEEDVIVSIGRFGPYVKHKNKFYSLGKDYDPYSVSLEEAIDIINKKREKDAQKIIKTFEENKEVQILKGRWGPYIKAGKINVKIPKGKDPSSLSYEECNKLIEEAKEKKK